MDKLTIIVMFVGLSGFLLFLFFYVIKRDKFIEEKIISFERNLDNLNKEVYFLKEELKKRNVNASLKEIESIIHRLINDVKKLETKHLTHIQRLEQKMMSIESSVKTKTIDFSNITKSDEQKIVSMYKNGYTIEEISKELRIPAGEVELVIKFQGL